MPYKKAKKNIGFTTIEGDIKKIDEELEDALIESIYINFKNKRLFKIIKKVQTINSIPNRDSSLVLYLDNNYINLDKSLVTYIGEIKTNITIKKISGDVIINKTYEVKAESVFGSPRSIALKLYKKIINDLMNQIEIKLGNLPSYQSIPGETSPEGSQEREGDFWM